MNSCPVFDVTPVVERLRSEVPSLKNVRGSADYAAIERLLDLVPPEAFVVLARERYESQPASRSQQVAKVFFGVVVGVRNYRGQLGKEAADSLLPVLGAVRTALLGWTPPVRGGLPCRLVQGDALDYDKGNLLWSDVYQTQQFIGG